MNDKQANKVAQLKRKIYWNIHDLVLSYWTSSSFMMLESLFLLFIDFSTPFHPISWCKCNEEIKKVSTYHHYALCLIRYRQRRHVASSATVECWIMSVSHHPDTSWHRWDALVWFRRCRDVYCLGRFPYSLEIVKRCQVACHCLYWSRGEVSW